MHPEPASLSDLAAIVGGRVLGDGSVTVADVTHDSRQAGPGKLFVAVRGLSTDGHRFVPSAVAAGAAAVCVEDETVVTGPAIVVGDTRSALGPIAAAVHGHPSAHLRVVGVTGTNGKTTVTHLVEAIAAAAGLPHAIVGTVGARIGGRSVAVARTTPEATDLQRLLAAMVSDGIDITAVEVSSHALALGRVAGTRFRVGAFTNLSRDHLDFHGDMESYFAAKAALFAQTERAVVCIDDRAGKRLAASVSGPLLTVGLDPGADLNGRLVESDFEGSSFVVTASGVERVLRTPLAGMFNVSNALVAAGCATALDVGWDSIADGLATVAPVPGRFELVETGRDFAVVVDYAHTPDGVAAAVGAARHLLAGSGRVIVVVGAGGDRDREKRPMMGRAASQADLAVLTTDNPRSERPDVILDEVAAGADGPGRVVRELDRRGAIRVALGEARPGDVVLVLGKGHEQGQDFGETVLPFDDRVVAREEVAAL
jgi:UDP-N-acetylmuramoyl-L-alanyl-D-glutamate--2,6-diaminopimelate ligase